MENMNYEFKDMATVDMAETVADTANVLIEEDGVIKRAPKNQVGGGNTEWDAEIEVDFYEYTTNLISGNYNDVYNKIINGEVPNIKLKIIYEYNDKEVNIQKSPSVSVIYRDGDETNHYIKICTITSSKNTKWIIWDMDGSLSI